MAIFKFNTGVSSIQSKIGGQYFTVSDKCNTIRNQNLFKNHRTPSQNVKMLFMMQCSRWWRNLTPTQHNNWHTWAATFPQFIIKDAFVFISGYSLYLKINWYKFQREGSSFTFMTDPVLYFYEPDTVAIEVKTDGEVLQLDLTFAEANENLYFFIFVSSSQSPGKEFGSTSWRLMAVVNNVSQVVNITSAYLAQFGRLPAIDDFIFTSSMYVGKDNGQYSFHTLLKVRISAIAPPPANSNLGYLYNWYASNYVVPFVADWRLPTQADFESLSTYLGFSVAGQKMKESGNTWWLTGNTGTNVSGFTGRGSGQRTTSFGFLKNRSFFITSTLNAGRPVVFSLQYNSNFLIFGIQISKINGNPIRLIYTGSGSPTYVDIDGLRYSTIQIGTQIWLAENLRAEHYSDGTDIPEVSDQSVWNQDNGEIRRCAFNNDPTNV